MSENSKELLQRDELQLDLFSMIRALIKDWWMILTAGLVGIIIAYLMAGTAYTPEYSSSMTFIVSSKGSTSNLSDLTAASGMAETFSEVLNSRLLRKKVQHPKAGFASFEAHFSTKILNFLYLWNLRTFILNSLCVFSARSVSFTLFSLDPK